MIPRVYDQIEDYLEPNKVLVIYGPRRVGKTTLVESFLSRTKLKYKYDSGDNVLIHDVLGSQSFDKILSYASGYDLIVLDEAQRIPNIGIGLKILVDQIPGIKIIATGSASFELAGQIGEPLTGRKQTLTLYPISQLELLNVNNEFELKSKLNKILLFGSYPAVYSNESESHKRDLLMEIVQSYLLKDILELEQVKGSKILLDLLTLLALQVGSQVSLSELAQKVGIDYKTVARYLDLLEKAFVIFELRGYSRNLRNEINAKSKYYFYDTGIRNALINNFNDLSMRDDVGKLWENFCVVERRKLQSYTKLYANNYFWRTWEQKEVDWVEERDGRLFGFEFTYSSDKQKSAPKQWRETYPDASFSIINNENYLEFVAKK